MTALEMLEKVHQPDGVTAHYSVYPIAEEEGLKALLNQLKKEDFESVKHLM